MFPSQDRDSLEDDEAGAGDAAANFLKEKAMPICVVRTVRTDSSQFLRVIMMVPP